MSTVEHLIAGDRQATSAARPLVLALHCSGGSGRQWRRLAELAGERAQVLAPDLAGGEAAQRWRGRDFSLADEAAALLAEIDRREEPVHLVGHSYGGGLALHVAARRPWRIGSLALYEPSAFHLLRGGALAEIAGIASGIGAMLHAGRDEDAARLFVDYWSGTGAWAAMREHVRAEVLRYLPKAPLDFAALLGERVPASRYGNFAFPVLLMRGGSSPLPALRIVRHLRRCIAHARCLDLAEAGHMGPVTHADAVATAILDHVRGSAAAAVAEQALAPA